MSIDENKLADILQDQFALSDTHLELARAWQKERGGPLAEILFEMRAVSEADLQKAHEVLGHGEVAAKYDGRNRRRNARITQLTDYNVIVRAPTEMEQATILDLSEGGVGIEVTGDAVVGQQIVVEVQSAGGTRVMCSGRVCHTKPAAGSKQSTVVGVQFEELSAVQKLAVAALLREAQKRERAISDVQWLD